MSTRKEWGNITWLLFHALAANVSENKFLEVRPILIDIIKGICFNLPCPDCSHDATQILKVAYIENIKTKEHFIEFLRQFHNIVNIKLGKKQISKNDLLSMYKKKNLKKIIQYFFYIYNKTSYNPNLLTHSFQRSQYLNRLKPKLNSIKFAY